MKRCAAIPSIALISPLKRKQMIRRRLFSVAGTDGTRRARKSGRVFRKRSGAEASIARAYYWLGGIYEKEEKKADAKSSYAASLKINPNQKDVDAAMKRVF